jgi:hypothetical protein
LIVCVQVFCFGETLQTVDMNQDNNLAEAYKMRNLLGEFNLGKGASLVVGAPGDSAKKFRNALDAEAKQGAAPVALVGFREWIFSGSVRATFIRVLTRSLAIG